MSIMESDRPRRVSQRRFSDELEADAVALAIGRGPVGSCGGRCELSPVVFRASRRARWRCVLRGPPSTPLPTFTCRIPIRRRSETGGGSGSSATTRPRAAPDHPRG